jgi:hypothetical protein
MGHTPKPNYLIVTGYNWGDEKKIISCYQTDPVFVPPLYSFMRVHSIFAKNCLGIKKAGFPEKRF